MNGTTIADNGAFGGGRTVLARLASGFRTSSPVWADGGYANSVDSTLLSWDRDALGIAVEIVNDIACH
ncbi:hypothetical protein ACWC0A_32995 [Streptomyces scopuliridis]